MTAKIHQFAPAVENDDHQTLVTVAEFARRVHRNKRTVYQWIKNREMPSGSVVLVHGHLEIDWAAWQKSVQRVI